VWRCLASEIDAMDRSDSRKVKVVARRAEGYLKSEALIKIDQPQTLLITISD